MNRLGERSEEDPYGRKKYYGYRASDGQLIRYMTGAYPSFSLADQATVFALTLSTALNPDYTVKDAITDQNGRPETVIDERGTISKTIYDAAGRVTQQIAAFGTAIRNDLRRCRQRDRSAKSSVLRFQ